MATKATVESKTISLYMCRGNRLHILNCKKTTTKGGSTSLFKIFYTLMLSWKYCSILKDVLETSGI